MAEAYIVAAVLDVGETRETIAQLRPSRRQDVGTHPAKRRLSGEAFVPVNLLEAL